MRSLIITIVISFLLGCAEPHTDEAIYKSFAFLEVPLSPEYSVKEIKHPDYSEWRLSKNADSLNILFFPANGVDSTGKIVASIYDSYLSLNKSESNKFSINFFTIDGHRARFIERRYEKGVFLEISFTGVKKKTCAFLITGPSITDQTANEIKEIVQHSRISI